MTKSKKIKFICVPIVLEITVLLIGISPSIHASFLDETASTVAYDPNDPKDPRNIIIQYCIQHADRVAAGEDVIKDLVGAGLVGSEFEGKTCAEVQSDKSMWDTLGPVINAK